ncbi:hypothetical protein HYH03_019089 [Edaphochlamys debaryana]|uniref:General transcription factor TFIIB n=1 Tax=Edaphochlamys debaryana TaxID=47281 RepID=A0A835XGJ9_9CHLO|nr:hypothetical protein HYH03_019089 [Edaphochlamys debaryana]|eukprot:KAG2481956.1 hypothetical protein HYH03_019089 [Edaphochlamys debaryana]
MDSEPCVTCKGDDFIEFKAEGDLVCRNCGTVKESRLIDERSEWRTFSDKDKDTTDPNRVGGPTNNLVEGLTTTIGRERNDGGLSYTLNRIHARTNNPDRPLQAAFKEVARMTELLKVNQVGGERGEGGGKACVYVARGGVGHVGVARMTELLKVNQVVKDRACEIYKEVVEAKSLKGRSIKALAASCLFWACRQEKQPRTFKEIVAVLGNDVSKKEIGKCFKDLQQLKKDELHKQGASADALASTMNQTVQEPREFALQYGNKLGLEFKLRKVAEDIARASKPPERRMPWDGRTPTSIASAVVFITMTMAEIKKDAEEARAGGTSGGARAIKALADAALTRVALVSQVAEATIRAAYKDLFPYIPDLLPKGWATQEEIARMPNPDGRIVAAAWPQQQQAAAAPAAPPAAPSAATQQAHQAAAAVAAIAQQAQQVAAAQHAQQMAAAQQVAARMGAGVTPHNLTAALTAFAAAAVQRAAAAAQGGANGQ